jgi:hypothetical protein
MTEKEKALWIISPHVVGKYWTISDDEYWELQDEYEWHLENGNITAERDDRLKICRVSIAEKGLRYLGK